MQNIGGNVNTKPPSLSTQGLWLCGPVSLEAFEGFRVPLSLFASPVLVAKLAQREEGN